jgi:hypothetical protein
VLHHQHPLAKALHQPQVVGDEQAGGAKLRLQTLQQGDNLRLQQQIEIRNRFIQDQQLRPYRQGASQADALQLSAAELRRAFIEQRRGKVDRLQHLFHRRARSSRDKRNRWRSGSLTISRTVLRGFTALKAS